MLRFKATWFFLLTTIVLSAASNYLPSSNNYAKDEPIITFGPLVPFEKFIEGDVQEPVLYGQYSLIENVSPVRVPLSPANSYQVPKPLPPNYQLLPSPIPPSVQYKPAKPVATYPVGDNLASAPVSYSPTSAGYPVAPVSYSPAVSVISYPSNPTVYPAPPITYSPAVSSPDVIYGYNYVQEQNQSPVFVPIMNYPQNSVPYFTSPPVYQPLLSAYSPAYSPVPIVTTYEQPLASKPNNSNAVVDGSYNKTVPPVIIDPLPPLPPPTYPAPAQPIPGEYPPVIIEPPVSPAPPVPLPVPEPTSYNSTATPIAKMVSVPNLPKAKMLSIRPHQFNPKSMKPRKNSEKMRYVGYNYLARQSSAKPTTSTTDKRASPAINAQTTENRNYQKTYSYRNVHPENRTSTTVDSNKRSIHQQFKMMQARPLQRQMPFSRNYIYNQKAYLSASSTFSYPTVYTENNVAEAVLRGYSLYPEDNNNKAIVRIFEEVPYALYFDMRICNLKKDQLYAVYIHDYGQITAGCESTGGLYGNKDTYLNLMMGTRSNPSGFLGAFKYPGEPMNFQHFSKYLTLSEILGRCIVIHEITTSGKYSQEPTETNYLNNFKLFMNPVANPYVSSKKVACGCICRANPYSFLRQPNQQCEIEVPVVYDGSSESYKRQADVKEEDQTKSDVKKESAISPLNS